MELDIKIFSNAIDYFPAAFRGNPLNLLFLEEAFPIRDSNKFLYDIDNLSLQDERREFVIDSNDRWPFPTFHIESRPDPWKISEVLFNNFTIAKDLLITQGNIWKIIIEKIKKIDPDIIILNIVDGLSYYDMPEKMDVTPCLVTGVSTTTNGFLSIIGKPSISQRLYSMGYKNQLAFTFFGQNNNPLSSELHSPFGTSQLHRINSMEEGLKIIMEKPFWRGFIQIVAPGLDKLSHYHADRPLIKENITRIIDRFNKTIDCASTNGRKVLGLLTSDHGILWRDIAEQKTIIVGDLFNEDAHHPRYVKGSIARNYSQIVKSQNQSFSILKAPYMTRRWKHSEWGVHGGLSAWESIIPIFINES